MSIYKKLLEMQKKVVGLGKDTAGHNYKYVSGGKVLENLKPLMNELGLLLKQEIINVEKEKIDYKIRSGEKSEMWYGVNFKFTWVDVETGETDVNMFYSSGMNDWEKGLGSALTYAERYFLLKFFHISTDEDDIDNPNRKQPEQPKTQDKKPFDKKKAEKCILELVGDNTELLEKEMELKGIKSFSEASEEQMKMLYKDIKRRLEKQ